MSDNLTVTVSVLTYNSSKFVIETLDSIKTQTYKDLILQICDDCSTDNTVELCKRWIENNKNRFVKTKIIVPEKNTGVSGNCNRAWDACETKYHKCIAGDDILLPNCIEEYMIIASTQDDVCFWFSRPYLFGVSKTDCDKYERDRFHYDFFDWTQELQYEDLRHGSKIPAATEFCNIELVRKYGIRHDERIPMLEDRPKWINCVWKGVKMKFLDKQLVGYRLRKDSLSNSGLLNPRFFESVRLAYFYYDFNIVHSQDPEKAVRDLVTYEKQLYEQYYQLCSIKKNFFGKVIFKLINIFK